MSEKKDNPVSEFDPGEIQTKIQRARQLMERGQRRESLIQYLQALEHSMAALQQSLGKLQQVLQRLQNLPRTKNLRMPQELSPDPGQGEKEYISINPPTLH